MASSMPYDTAMSQPLLRGTTSKAWQGLPSSWHGTGTSRSAPACQTAVIAAACCAGLGGGPICSCVWLPRPSTVSARSARTGRCSEATGSVGVKFTAHSLVACLFPSAMPRAPISNAAAPGPSLRLHPPTSPTLTSAGTASRRHAAPSPHRPIPSLALSPAGSSRPPPASTSSAPVAAA